MAEDAQGRIAQLQAQGAALAGFGLLAFRSEDLDSILHEATMLVSQALDVDLVKVLEHRPARGDMLMCAGVHWKPGTVGHVSFPDHAGSPGGYALRSDTPVVSPDTAQETRFAVPQVLWDHGVQSMVNVIIPGRDAPFGVLEVDARTRRAFSPDDVAFLQNYANLLAGAIDRHRTHQQLRVNAEEQRILARELSHRVKNVLSVVHALAAQTAAHGRSGQEYQDVFMGRLRALSAAESLVFAGGEAPIDLAGLIEAVLEPYAAAAPGRVTANGEPTAMPARHGRMLGLALHELATNAAKYGALSVQEGRVRIGWTPAGPDLAPDAFTPRRIAVEWAEEGGPRVAPPARTGFGTRLLRDIVAQELNGEAQLLHHPQGLVYRIVFDAGAG